MEVTLTDIYKYVSREYTVPGFKRMLVIALHLKSERDYKVLFAQTPEATSFKKLNIKDID